jgi:triacylglycerol lipase
MLRRKPLLKQVYLILAFVLIVSFSISCDETKDTGPSTDTSDLVGSGPPQGVTFDIDTAVELMRLSLQSYQMLIDFDNGDQFILPQPYKLVIQFLTPESFLGTSLEEAVPIAFVATANNNIYVVFRGTKTIDEWISDADFPLVPYTFVDNGGMTEKGFTEIYESLGVVDEVNQLSDTGNFENVFVTGHSLGAALAVLAPPDIIENTEFKDPIMYSFAGPRAGNSDFKDLYDGFGIASWRVFNTNDEVPKLPPTFLSYVHVNTGEPITFGKPVSGPFDFKDIEFNHDSCNYYNTLCDMTADPDTCKAMADGADGCNANS